MSRRTVKARFVATIEIDLDDWNYVYGKDETPAEVRQSILWHLDDLVRTCTNYADEHNATITTNAV